MIASPILNLVKRGRKTSQRSDIFQPPWSITNQNSKPQPHGKRERESYKKKEPRSCHKLPETEKNICSHVYDVHTGPGHANGKYRWATTDQPTDQVRTDSIQRWWCGPGGINIFTYIYNTNADIPMPGCLLGNGELGSLFARHQGSAAINVSEL